MVDKHQGSQPGFPLLQSLADFRYLLRSFLHYSEAAALACGLQPQQHQLLLQIAAVDDPKQATISYAAERLGLRHNSAVELVSRSEAQGLLVRKAAETDGRKVLLRITPHGSALLRQLSLAHAEELYTYAPDLLRSLRKITRRRKAV